MKTKYNHITMPHGIAIRLATCLLAWQSLGTPAYAENRSQFNAGWVTFEQLHTLVAPDSLPKDATVQVSLVKQDERIGTPACPEALFSNTTNNRLWGRTFLKVQCIGGESSGFFVGVDFDVFAPVLVIKKTISIGQALEPDDVEFTTTNIAQLPQGWINNMAHINNKTATRTLTPGLVLRQDYMKGTPLIRRGDTVRVTMKGQGFSIGGSAQAVEAAEQGQSIKVKTSQGKILTGIATEPSLVELTL
jgi:flagella basal body P-ring formation protein FlgA